MLTQALAQATRSRSSGPSQLISMSVTTATYANHHLQLGFPRNVPSALRRGQASSTRRIRTIPSWACPATSGSVFWLDRHSRPRDGNMTETGIRVAQPVPSRPNSSVFYFTPRVNSEGPQKTHRRLKNAQHLWEIRVARGTRFGQTISELIRGDARWVGGLLIPLIGP